MTNPPTIQSAPAVPISALLAPQSPRFQPQDLLPSPSAAVLGPLPPTCALHLVLNYIALSDLPEYEHSSASESERDAIATGKTGAESHSAKTTTGGRAAPARALIITGNKDGLYHALQDEDEDWMREHAGGYGVMSRLKRCDIRYCSTPQQLTLLLAMLNSEKSAGGDDATYNLFPPPGLIILYDIAALFMHWQGGDENARPNSRDMDVDGHSETEMKRAVGPQMVFNDDTVLSTYLDVISAARTASQHLSHGHHSTQLVILEPNISDTSTLPIMPKHRAYPSTASSTNTQRVSSHLAGVAGINQHDANLLALSSQSRSKRITIIDGLSWLLGRGNVGVVTADETTGDEQSEARAEQARDYTLSFPDSIQLNDGRYRLRRRRCERGEWASRVSWSEGQSGSAAGGIGGWRWEWAEH